ncbi:GAF domain-containing protein [uncultured Desulfobacter sp.]|uniref:GAF domain-containing protein n=1 Tax=uncultured Desulfobacter sp. TaxID=240139 RepID=UPI0029C84352|nr:GAF domain-containing protein [uncultured Desulfobacter sp.]
MSSNDKHANLREKAVQLLSSRNCRHDILDQQNIKKLFEELQIHRIELEIQNEELMRAQKRLEVSRMRYVNLFDQAPVGYVVLDSVGIIKHFNSTFLDMIQRKTLKSSGHAFADLLKKNDADAFRARYKAFFKTPGGKQIEAQLVLPGGHCIDVLIEARHQTGLPEDFETRSINDLMITITDITDLQHARRQSQKAIQYMREKEVEIHALLAAARSILEQKNFKTTARHIFDICSQTIGSLSGYIALLSDDGLENEVLFLEDGGLPCTVDPDLPMPIRGLRQQAYQSGEVVYDNAFMDSQWTGYLPDGHVALNNVMFAPLIINAKVVGVMGLANKRSDFTENDARIAKGFGELAAIGLKNARLQDKRDLAEKEKQTLIDELTQALENVKQLSGLVPICQHCKKIRDDKGYWNQIEVYLQKHSDAKFSHGICEDCAQKYYPDLDLYD